MARLTAAETLDFLCNRLVTVESSNVHAIAWDGSGETLTVQFKTRNGAAGKVYQYHGVGARKAGEFAEAPSKGKWLDENLKKSGTGYTKLTAFD